MRAARDELRRERNFLSFSHPLFSRFLFFAKVGSSSTRGEGIDEGVWQRWRDLEAQ